MHNAAIYTMHYHALYVQRIDARRREHLKQRSLDSKRLLQRNRNVQAVLEAKQSVEGQKLVAEIRKSMLDGAVTAATTPAAAHDGQVVGHTAAAYTPYAAYTVTFASDSMLLSHYSTSGCARWRLKHNCKGRVYALLYGKVVLKPVVTCYGTACCGTLQAVVLCNSVLRVHDAHSCQLLLLLYVFAGYARRAQATKVAEQGKHPHKLNKLSALSDMHCAIVDVTVLLCTLV
jgi:hypothetical protein